MLSPHLSPNVPGRMTAVMRAVGARKEGAKALRVALVQKGRVIDERLVKDGAVTLGEAEDCTFVVPGLARTHRLIVAQGGKFVLFSPPGAQGKVGLADGVVDLAPRLVLDAGARGRVAIGQSTILFQVIDAPIPPARPRLPLAVKQGVFDQVDWRLTIIAAFSFLLHFGFVGSMYSDWRDPILDESVTVQGLVDLTPPIAPPPLEPSVEPSPEPSPSPSPQHDPAPGPSHAGPRRGSAPADPSAGLVAAAEEMRLGLIATVDPGNTAVADALRRSNIPPVQLDRSDGNVGADRELTLRTQGPIDPSARRGDLANVGVQRGDAKDHAGPINDTPGPRYSVDTRYEPGVVPTPGAERTIAGLRPGFRRCYEQGMAQSGPMSGSVLVRVKIRPNGEVERASIVKLDGLTNDVAQCVAHKIELAQFDPPKSDASLDVPVIFKQQK